MHEQPRKLFAKTLFIGVGGFWGGFFSLDVSIDVPWGGVQTCHVSERAKVALVSHYSAIGDTISCDAPYSAIGFKGKLALRYPGLSLDCNRPCLRKQVGA